MYQVTFFSKRISFRRNGFGFGFCVVACTLFCMAFPLLWFIFQEFSSLEIDGFLSAFFPTRLKYNCARYFIQIHAMLHLTNEHQISNEVSTTINNWQLSWMWNNGIFCVCSIPNYWMIWKTSDSNQETSRTSIHGVSFLTLVKKLWT